MNKMNYAESYRKIISLRQILKRITQLSWEMAQWERRYSTEKIPEKEIPNILNGYKDFAGYAVKVLDEIKNELETAD